MTDVGVRIDAVKADVKALQNRSVERFKRNLFHPLEGFPLSTLEQFEAIENSESVDDIVKIVSSLVTQIIVFFSILMWYLEWAFLHSNVYRLCSTPEKSNLVKRYINKTITIHENLSTPATSVWEYSESILSKCSQNGLGTLSKYSRVSKSY